MPGFIAKSTLIFLAPVWGAHYDTRKLVNLAADSSLLRARPASAGASALDRGGDDNLPDDEDELRQLCHTVGFGLACRRLDNRLSPKLATERSHDITDGISENGTHCLPPGQLVFAHVMKTGGLTVDSFLDCQCKAWDACTVRHADGAVTKAGASRCPEPTICTMHRGVARIQERCGRTFTERKPRMFTVIRDPIERVWSFFNYLKRWYLPYQQHGLPWIFENFGRKNLNDGLSYPGTCLFCAGELSNAMTLQYFCPDADLCDPLLGVPLPPIHLMARVLEKAKGVLSRMDAVFLTSDLDRFDFMFTKDRRLYPPLADVSKDDDVCKLRKEINTNPNKTELVDPVTIAAISKYNRADMLLFQYARTLPNFWTKDLLSSPVDGKPWASEYNETHADRLLKEAMARIEEGQAHGPTQGGAAPMESAASGAAL